LSRNRRLAKDYERMVQTSEALIELAATRLPLRRLASRNTAPDVDRYRHVEQEGASNPQGASADFDTH